MLSKKLGDGAGRLDIVNRKSSPNWGIGISVGEGGVHVGGKLKPGSVAVGTRV
jgi:hypothetical protein